MSTPASVVVLVIGAGQAGLSAAFHLRRRGFTPSGSQDGREQFVVLDDEVGPGGAWRHRWQSLRMATVNDISDLPGVPQPDVDPCEPSSEFLTRYFGDYERELGLHILDPSASLQSAGRTTTRTGGSSSSPAAGPGQPAG